MGTRRFFASNAALRKGNSLEDFWTLKNIKGKTNSSIKYYKKDK